MGTRLARRRRAAAVAGLVAAVAVVIAIGVQASRYAAAQARAAEWVEHTHTVIEELTLVGSTLSEVESGVRAYATTGDRTLLDDARRPLEAIAEHARRVTELTRDNPVQQLRLDGLLPVLARRAGLLRQRLTAFTNGAADPGVTPEGVALSRDIRARLAALIGEERHLLATRGRDVQRDSAGVRWLALFGPSLAAALVAAAGFLLLREMARGRHTARQLELKHRQLDSIIEGTPDAIYVKDLDGRFVLTNSAWQRMMGRQSGEMLRKTATELMTADLAAALMQDDSDIARTGASRTVEEVLPVDGQRRIFLSTKGPLRDEQGAIVGVLTISRDVTERRQQDEARFAEITLHLSIGELLQAARSLDECYDVVKQMAPRFFPDEAGAVFLFHDSRDHLESHAHWGAGAGSAEWSAPFALDDCWAIRRGQAHALDPGLTNMRCKHARDGGPPHLLCVPLLASGEMLGILHLRSDAPIAAPARARANLLGEQLAMAFANLRLRETLRNQSIRDPLTGLFNRRYVDETLARELKRAERDGSPVSVLAIDVDHFKRFNDSFGHDAGDHVLRALGAFLREQTRAGDMACRMGGEELLVVLPGADAEGARVKAERLRVGVRQLELAYLGGALGQVTASIGVATFPTDGGQRDELLRAADLALYRAKREGRDRVIAADRAALSAAPEPSPAAARPAPT